MVIGANSVTTDCLNLYLDLMKKSLCDLIYRVEPFDLYARTEGKDWPKVGHTMIGVKRMENVRLCMENVLRQNIAGDFIETGVWRGGTCIFMRAVLKAHGVTNRKVWICDSFEGFPVEPNPVEGLHEISGLAVSLGQVVDNFDRYGLLDEQVQFVKGWFWETLQNISASNFAIVRLDSDRYNSTMDALNALYPKLSVGGYLIADDYGAHPGCRQAIHEYRECHSITEKIEQIDWAGVYWKKEQ